MTWPRILRCPLLLLIGCSTPPDAAPDARATADVDVRFRFGGSDTMTCAAAGVEQVEIDLVQHHPNADDTRLETDFPTCDQAMTYVAHDVPFGTYDVFVVTWAAQLWKGAAQAVSHTAAAPASVTIDLELVPVPPGSP